MEVSVFMYPESSFECKPIGSDPNNGTVLRIISEGNTVTLFFPQWSLKGDHAALKYQDLVEACLRGITMSREEDDND